jgi:hypothetical protein
MVNNNHANECAKQMTRKRKSMLMVSAFCAAQNDRLAEACKAYKFSRF